MFWQSFARPFCYPRKNIGGGDTDKKWLCGPTQLMSTSNAASCWYPQVGQDIIALVPLGATSVQCKKQDRCTHCLRNMRFRYIDVVWFCVIGFCFAACSTNTQSIWRLLCSLLDPSAKKFSLLLNPSSSLLLTPHPNIQIVQWYWFPSFILTIRPKNVSNYIDHHWNVFCFDLFYNLPIFVNLQHFNTKKCLSHVHPRLLCAPA